MRKAPLRVNKQAQLCWSPGASPSGAALSSCGPLMCGIFTLQVWKLALEGVCLVRKQSAQICVWPMDSSGSWLWQQCFLQHHEAERRAFPGRDSCGGQQTSNMLFLAHV